MPGKREKQHSRSNCFELFQCTSVKSRETLFGLYLLSLSNHGQCHNVLCMCWLINVFSRLSNFILMIVCQQIHKNWPSIKAKSRRSVDGGKMTSGVAIGEEAIARDPKTKKMGREWEGGGHQM